MELNLSKERYHGYCSETAGSYLLDNGGSTAHLTRATRGTPPNNVSDGLATKQYQVYAYAPHWENQFLS